MKRVLMTLALAACAAPTGPEGAVRITPPAEYRAWWEASRACVDKPEWRAFDQIEWYVSPERPVTSDGDTVGAFTRESRIYLWVQYAETPWVVQHELVHAINRLGNDHPADPFVTCHLMPFQHKGEGV